MVATIRQPGHPLRDPPQPSGGRHRRLPGAADHRARTGPARHLGLATALPMLSDPPMRARGAAYLFLHGVRADPTGLRRPPRALGAAADTAHGGRGRSGAAASDPGSSVGT